MQVIQGLQMQGNCVATILPTACVPPSVLWCGRGPVCRADKSNEQDAGLQSCQRTFAKFKISNCPVKAPMVMVMIFADKIYSTMFEL